MPAEIGLAQAYRGGPKFEETKRILERSSREHPKGAPSRWEIENQGFNEAKSRHGLEHICPHYANSLLIGWFLAMLALTIEQLCRLRYLHRVKLPMPSSAQLLLHLWLSLSRPCNADGS